MFHVKVDYPDREQEREIIMRTTGLVDVELQALIRGPEIVECQRIVRGVPVPDHVTDFILDLVRRCRPNEADAPAFIKELVEWGPGPRACQMLALGGKVRALLQGRYHVTVDDIEALSRPVLRHRIVPTFNAEAEGVSTDAIIARALQSVPRRDVRSAI
jgi:MoxR-like ATPase